MRTAPAFLVLVLLTGCYTSGVGKSPAEVPITQREIERAPVTRARVVETSALSGGPCGDALYLELKEKPLDEMTDREHEYFTRKDEACTEYQTAQLRAEPQERMAGAIEKTASTYRTVLAISAMSSIAALLFLFAL